MASRSAGLSAYTELAVLGEGASGRVALARHNVTGTIVAIKHLADALCTDPGFLARFRDEARTLRELHHPNIAGVYEYIEEDAGAALVLELVNGVTLRRLLEHGIASSAEAALLVLKGSLQGLACAHAAGLVHRDYKPENVLVDSAGVSRLVDFGIAVAAGSGVTSAGTPLYMAPESWGAGVASPSTDVYAATAVFFECLTGRPPFVSEHVAELRRLHQTVPVDASMLTGPVRELVLTGLAKDPQSRFASAGAFLEQLEAVALTQYGPEWEARGRRALAAAVAALAAFWPLSAAGGAAGNAGSAAAEIGLAAAGTAATGAALVAAAPAHGGAASPAAAAVRRTLRARPRILAAGAAAGLAVAGAGTAAVAMSGSGPFRHTAATAPPAVAVVVRTGAPAPSGVGVHRASSPQPSASAAAASAGPDYRVKWSPAAVPGIVLSGQKCGGPGGQWQLNYSGSFSGFHFSGPLVMVIDTSNGSPSGPWPMHGTEDVTFSGEMQGTLHTTFQGMASLRDSALVITGVDSSGTVSMSANGVSFSSHISGGSVFTNVCAEAACYAASAKAGSGTVTMPVQSGSFC